MVAIRRVFEANFHVYGVRKVWRQRGREGSAVARCTVARLMRAMGLKGVVRGKTVRTTISDPTAACPLDRLNRPFKAPHPNALWLSDFTSVATWAGFVSVAFVIDVFARRILGWRVSRTARASFVPAPCRMLWSRPCASVSLSGAAASYIRATGVGSTLPCATPSGSPRPASSRPSAASATATTTRSAGTINGLFKAEVIHRRGPWRSYEAVAFAGLEWVDWYNTRHLLAPIGNVPLAEAEARYYTQAELQTLAA